MLVSESLRALFFGKLPGHGEGGGMNLYLKGEAARRAGVCADTVRNYCRDGLLDPIRDSSGRRLFTDEDVKKIRSIYLDNLNRIPARRKPEPVHNGARRDN